MKNINELTRYLVTSTFCVILAGLDISPALAENTQKIDIDTLMEYKEIYYEELPSMDLREDHSAITSYGKFKEEMKADYTANYFELNI